MVPFVGLALNYSLRLEWRALLLPPTGGRPCCQKRPWWWLRDLRCLPGLELAGLARLWL